MFNLLGFEAVLNCDYFRDGTYGGKDKLVKKDQQINKVKHECVIEIEVEIGKPDERRDVMLDTNMSGQGDPSKLKKYSTESVFKCAKCEYKTKTIDKFEKHRKVHEKIKKCDECEFETTGNRTLAAHKRTHIGDRPFKCDQCDYKAKRNNHIIIHKQIHTSKKNFECDLCDYKCRVKGALVFHKRIHTGEKPFKCDQCDYKATQSGSLIAHRRIHTGEMPFACDRCEYAAKTLNVIRRGYIQGRSRLFVICVNSKLVKLVIFPVINGYTVERSLLNVNNVKLNAVSNQR